MQVLICRYFWRKKTRSLLGVLIILSIWITAYLFLSTTRLRNNKDVVNCVSNILTDHAIFTSQPATYNAELNLQIDSEKKEGKTTALLETNGKAIKKKDINFRDRFFDWQDSKSDIEPKIGPDKVINASKYFIYRCDTYTMHFCGGWGDRVKGIMAAYLIANLTGRVFKIELINPPCDVTEMLAPNVVNWSLPTPFHKIVTRNTTGVIKIDMIGNLAFIREMQYMNFTEWLGTEAEYVYFKGNAGGIEELRKSKVYQQQLSWMDKLSINDIAGIIFKRLFKLSAWLKVRMKHLLTTMAPTSGHKLVCAHVRVGKNPSNPLDNIVKTSAEELPNIWNFLKQKSRTNLESVFIMSDSEAVIEEAKRQDFGQRLFVTQGAVVHVDKFSNETSEELCSGLEKIIFDQHVLMACDVLMIGKSGLSKLAACVRGENQGLYVFQNGGKVVQLNLFQ